MDIKTNKESPFASARAVAGYLDQTPLKVPGLADLHRMTMLLLSERAQQDARILVIGAGGGMEVRALGEAQPSWSFVSVDPSASMLDLASQSLQSMLDRVQLQKGTIDVVSEVGFDGATCLLTLHFLDRSDRRHTLKEIRRRLKPGARLVVAHHTSGGGNAVQWLTRSAGFSDRTGSDWDRALHSGKAMAEALPILAPAEEEDLLRDAGFVDVELFYAAFSFRGWVATA
ncbi:class I SAM-dependent methyltransferase [Paracoccus sp. SY]|uniref:class I SAM-dependent methyltransferase n=1 Tax=Paracoccus sp. SY TaxID=1330255 RepID=UPI000CD066C6|nr:class I SAM-dependent methyltransferase [Paracoccus sp. SY]